MRNIQIGSVNQENTKGKRAMLCRLTVPKEMDKLTELREDITLVQRGIILCRNCRAIATLLLIL